MTPSGVRHTAAHNAVIGRHASADIVLADPLASRRHARLEHGAGRWSITDLGSRHGTRINGSPATPDSPLRLEEGDEIVIGQSRLTVRFSDAVSSLKSPPTPDDAGTITDIETSGDKGLSAERLRTLSRLTREIIVAGNETQVLRLVTDAVRAALTVERVAIIERDQTTGRLIERAVSGASGISASRGFVAAAIDSDSVVRLDQQPELAGARSVHLQNIRSALCVRLGEQAERNPLGSV